jgi:hypothetical protein
MERPAALSELYARTSRRVVVLRAVWASLLAVCLAGCSHGGSKHVQATGQQSTGWHAYGGTVNGDVDGDGRPERIGVDRRGTSCRFRHTVRSPRGELEAQLSETACMGGLPRVKDVAAVDRRPGQEIIVDVWRGASTEFAALWTVRRSSLQQLRFQECCNGSFPYHGSVGHDDRVDCVAGKPGVIVSSSARVVASRGTRERLAVARSFYRISGSTLTKIRSERHRIVTRSGPPYPEWREPQPFPSCPRALAAE